MTGAVMNRRLSFHPDRSGLLLLRALLCMLGTVCMLMPVVAQTTATPSPDKPAIKPAIEPDTQSAEEIERRLNEVTTALNQTQKALQQSLIEIQQLRGELDALKLKSGVAAVKDSAAANVAGSGATGGAPMASGSSELDALHEQMDAMQAEIAQHEQTKVETASKYAVRINGLVLFNAFSNVGVVDDADVPTIALPRHPDASHGSLGATVRQTLLGFEAIGPHVWNARSSARLSVDFFGGASTNEYGYSAPTGFMRLRQTDASLDWERTTAQVGITEPLITPLSPTSYATVAIPGLSASGNLWAWSPQLRVERRIPFSDQTRLTLEGGLIDPGSPAYTSIQLVTPVEASKRPGYEGRIAFQADRSGGADAHSFVIGVGGYSSDQYYAGGIRIHSWAVTGDWQIPLSKWMEITGEAYRGRALGGFGAGGYKDILMGTDSVTGLTRTAAVDAVGGWSQAKFRFRPTIEANAAWGLDNALASSFDGLILSTSTNPLALNARNSSFIGNVIYRPRTYLIFSPEYRRLQSWQYDGPSSVADIFTITAGFQF
jgi:hypothetical protein